MKSTLVILLVATAVIGCTTKVKPAEVNISGDGVIIYTPESMKLGQKFLAQCEERFVRDFGQNLSAQKVSHGQALVNCIYRSDAAECYWFAFSADSVLYLVISNDLEGYADEINSTKWEYGTWLAKNSDGCTTVEIPTSDPSRATMYRVLCWFIWEGILSNVIVN